MSDDPKALAELGKRLAAEAAAELVESGQVVGLGSGSTVELLLQALGRRVAAGLAIRGIATSGRTERSATAHGIPLVSPAAVDGIDISIDGADEIAPDGTMIKGGGGALAREKIVASMARHRVTIVDRAKLVDRLGVFPLPVEVLPFGAEVVARRIAAEHGVPVAVRRRQGDVFVTDNGNPVLDCHFAAISDPARLDQVLRAIPGVVETGLFLGLVDLLLVGADGEVFERRFERR